MKTNRPYFRSAATYDTRNVVAATLAAVVLAGCSDPSANVTPSATGEAMKVGASAVGARDYVIQPESTIGFVGSKVTGSHSGGFKQFTGKVSVLAEKVTGAEVNIDMDSTWSDSDRLTGHLKNADFFDVPKFPKSTFTVTSIVPGGTNQTVTGNLELHGVTKSITFPAEIRLAADSVSVQAEFSINRRDFDINYAGRANDLIRDGVVLKLDIQAKPGAGPTP